MNSAITSNLILDKEAVRRKIKRMALEVAEQNTDADEITIAGIIGHGTVLAKCIADELKRIVPLKTQVVTIHLNKKDPLQVAIEPTIAVQNKTIILVDDVANTGKTM